MFEISKIRLLVLAGRFTKLVLQDHALVAQLDRVPGYEPGGRGFESSPARHIYQ